MEPQFNPMSPGPAQPNIPSPVPGAVSGGMPIGQQPQSLPGELASPEEREQLMRLLEATKEKMDEVEFLKFDSTTKKEEARMNALRSVFVMMQEAGVDLTDPNSVSSFIAQVKQSNPQMGADFEQALTELLEEPMLEGELPNEDNMNFNEALPEELRGPISGESQPNPFG